jgi:hypothetical protein
MTACNLFPAATGAYIRPKDQRRSFMTAAVNFLRALPPDTVIVTDNGGGLLLTYYFCGENHDPYHTAGNVMRMRCGNQWVVTPDPDTQDRLLITDHPPTAAMYGLPPGSAVWIFEAGWITGGKKHDASREIHRLKCSNPLQFGRNILLCKIVLRNEASE